MSDIIEQVLESATEPTTDPQKALQDTIDYLLKLNAQLEGLPEPVRTAVLLKAVDA